MKKIILCLTVTLWAVSHATAQDNIHDATVNNLMGVEDWIALREYLDDYGEEVSDFYRLTASAMWKMHSNQSTAAAGDLDAALKEFGQYLDPMTWVTLKSMLCQCYINIRRVDKFIEACDDMLAEAGVPEEIKDMIRAQKTEIGEAELLPQPTVQWYGEGTVIDMDSLTMFKAESHGEIINCFFDTGAQQNVISSKELADRLGVRYLSTDTTVLNERGSMYMGTLDSVKIGNITVRDLTVVVMITEISSLVPDSIYVKARENVDATLEFMNRMELILGMPVLLQLGELRFDSANRKIHIPRDAVTPKENGSYAYVSDNILFTDPVIEGRRIRGWLDTGGFSESVVSWSYLTRNPGIFDLESFSKTQHGTMQMDGLRKYECYVWPCPQVEWAGCRYNMDEIFIEAGDYGVTHTSNRGELTMTRDFFNKFDNLVFNFREMWIRCF